jgi:N-acetylmuramoyl-L-alanine amidase
MGVKAEDVNMEVALFLRGYLEGAGARVYLTRERSKNPSLTTKIMMVERFGAERFLSTGHGGAADPTFNSTFVLHYPNSKLGIAGKRGSAALGSSP